MMRAILSSQRKSTPLFRRTFVLLALALFYSRGASAQTDDVQAAKIKPPAVWAFPNQEPLRVLEVRGLWFRMFGVEAALSRLGGAQITQSWHSPASVLYYPESYEELMRHHLIIIANVNGGALGAVRRKMLKDYVANGGAILFLGGRYAFQEFHGTALEEIAPVTFAPNGGWTRATGGVLKAAPDAKSEKLDWAKQPRVFWTHKVVAKPGAKVLLTSEGAPMLVTGAFGKGRVAVFAGSVSGEAGAGQMPFWEWNDWPQVLAQTVSWLVAPTAKSAGNDDLQKVIATQIAAAKGKSRVEEGVLFRWAPLCSDPKTAQLLAQTALGGEGDMSSDVADELAFALAPFANESLAPLAKALIATEAPHKAALGLALLGHSKAAGAGKILASALQSGEVKSDEPNMLDTFENDSSDSESDALGIRLGALQGLGYLGDAAQLPLIKASIEANVSRAGAPLAKEEIAREVRLYNAAVLAALGCGDSQSASAAVDAVLKIRYNIFYMMALVDLPDFNNDPEVAALKVRVSAQIPRVRLYQKQMIARFHDLPASVFPALARRLADEDDEGAIALAQAAFGGRKLSAETIKILKSAPLKAVADLGLQSTPE